MLSFFTSFWYEQYQAFHFRLHNKAVSRIVSERRKLQIPKNHFTYSFVWCMLSSRIEKEVIAEQNSDWPDQKKRKTDSQKTTKNRSSHHRVEKERERKSFFLANMRECVRAEKVNYRFDGEMRLCRADPRVHPGGCWLIPDGGREFPFSFMLTVSSFLDMQPPMIHATHFFVIQSHHTLE